MKKILLCLALFCLATGPISCGDSNPDDGTEQGGGGNGGRGAMTAVNGGDGENGAANTGGGAGGAGGGWYEDPYKSQPGAAGNGGSGIVILRGTQEDNIPVIFNGTQLDKIIYNGVTLTSLIYNGTKLYCRNMKQALGRLMRRNGYEICHLG